MIWRPVTCSFSFSFLLLVGHVRFPKMLLRINLETNLVYYYYIYFFFSLPFFLFNRKPNYGRRSSPTTIRAGMQSSLSEVPHKVGPRNFSLLSFFSSAANVDKRSILDNHQNGESYFCCKWMRFRPFRIVNRQLFCFYLDFCSLEGGMGLCKMLRTW